ncbi:hypothetical protein A2U01_0042875, partial [Trifolium medium]|nr:hypothetical protein [Trifolium medium]
MAQAWVDPAKREQEVLAWGFVLRVLLSGGNWKATESPEKLRDGGSHRAVVADNGERCERHVRE